MLQQTIIGTSEDVVGYRFAGTPAGSDAGLLCSADQVRRLADEDFLRGARRRRFAYDPPDGWLGSAHGFTTTWEPGEPGDAARITVWPAMARTEDASLLIDEMLADVRGGFYENHGRVTVRSREGLTGDLWQLVAIGADGTRRSCDLLVLQDERFLYPIRLLTAPEQHVRNLVDLFDLIHSVQPFVPATEER